ncbi:MAG TPA: TraB/GumN family protein [Rhodanobacteraceae bacterium]|nr:TraB/GumN family protein [Rhodanobacteraceae bacterium]
MSDSDSTPPDPATADAAAPEPLAGQPVVRVEREGVEYVLLGTAHVSRASVEAVKAMLRDEHFDAVAVELCDSRARAMRDPDAFKRMDLFQVIRQGKTGMVAASLVLSSFQKRLAAQFGIEPGAEMRTAMDGAAERGLPLWLVDREVGITFKRCWRGLGFGGRMRLLLGLVGSMFEREDISEDDIEKLKQGDLMEGAFAEFASESRPLYQGLIRERDGYMAARLRQESLGVAPGSRVLVVIGAGHQPGLAGDLREQTEPPAQLCEQLDAIPPAARWPKWLAGAIVVAIFAAIGWAFYRSPSMGIAAVRSWVLYTGCFAALGALVSGGHPLSIIAAFIAAPLKPFRPGIPAGAVSALTEAWVRRPRVGDFETLRDDLGHLGGWWRNRVARTLMIFMLTNIGTIAGEYLAGYHIFTTLF